MDTSRVVPVRPSDLPDILELYARSYPGNWFMPQMLQTGLYKGIREGNAWLAVGGVHVFSALQRVAAIGNVTTDPRRRRRGLAAAVTAAICSDLLQSVDVIGLNVHLENEAALACYASLGFRAVAEYDEVLLERHR